MSDYIKGMQACMRGDECPEGASERFQAGYGRQYEIEQRLTAASEQGCSLCGPGLRPSHNGSTRCESGSIASGGTKAHCSCDICF